MKAIRIHETGGPEVLRLEEIKKPRPSAGQVLIKVAAAGVNYADIMQREGTYLTPTKLPTTLGLEVAGTVEELGEGVSWPPVGTRVAALVEGGYAEYVLAYPHLIIPIPETLDFVHAAAFPLQGVTAYQLLHECAHLQPGESVLVHAAAGGVGTLAVQLARLMGAGKVIGTASTEEKLEFARSLGADVTINYTQGAWVDQVLAATEGKGVDIILEMVGGEIGKKNLQCLAPFGRMPIYGATSGKMSVDGFLQWEWTQFTGVELMYKNQTVTGYWLTEWVKSRPDSLAVASKKLMQFLASGQIKIIVGLTFPLEEAANAHRALAERKTKGKVVLIVESR